jgi:hypothetical protein
MNLTKIDLLDKYLSLIGKKSDIVAIWEHGSYLEGIADKYSDRDFVVFWEKSIPPADLRLKIARKLNLDIHEIKDVISIGQSFDLFSDGKHLFNVAHCLKEINWYEKLNNERFSSDVEKILIFVSSLQKAKIYWQKDKWVDKLRDKLKIDKNKKEKLLSYFKDKISVYLVSLEQATYRADLLYFIEHLEKVLRMLQLIYLVDNNLPILSSKHFEKRFARLEKGKITSLVRNIAESIDMEQIFKEIVKVTEEMGTKKSEKMKA